MHRLSMRFGAIKAPAGAGKELMGEAGRSSEFDKLNPAQITFRAAKFCFTTFYVSTQIM